MVKRILRNVILAIESVFIILAYQKYVLDDEYWGYQFNADDKWATILNKLNCC